jgi:hypothetical protein
VPAFLIDTPSMTGTVGNIQDAADRLGTLEDLLEDIHNRLQSSTTMSQDEEADNKIESFRSRWKDEFGIIGDMLGKFKGAITKASEIYDGTDLEIADGIRKQADPGTPPAAPTASA